MAVELLLPYHRPADVSPTFVLHPLPFWGLTSTYKRDTVYIIFTRSHYNCINTPTTTTHYKYVFTHYRKTDDEKADCIGQPSYFCGGCFWILLGRKQWSKGPTMGMVWRPLWVHDDKKLCLCSLEKEEVRGGSGSVVHAKTESSSNENYYWWHRAISMINYIYQLSNLSVQSIVRKSFSLVFRLHSTCSVF